MTNPANELALRGGTNAWADAVVAVDAVSEALRAVLADVEVAHPVVEIPSVTVLELRSAIQPTTEREAA